MLLLCVCMNAARLHVPVPMHEGCKLPCPPLSAVMFVGFLQKCSSYLCDAS